MGKSVPTPEDLDAAQEYALAKLCTEIPTRYGAPGLTEWDKNRKACKITEKGCQQSVFNPISQPVFNSGGEYIVYDKHHPTFGDFWAKQPPGYYVWRVTEKSPTTKVCAPANFLMQQWCEAPKTRSDKQIPGVTDAVPFEYNIRLGKEECEIPKSYCDSKGVSYDATKKDCFVKDSQKVAEFFTGSVFIRNQNAKKAASDKRLKKSITLVRKNFPVEGIHVYAYEWNNIAMTMYGHSGADVGFIADDLDPKYIVYDSHGYKHINLDYDDDIMRKIYAFLKIKEEIKNIRVQ